ncbi:MAG: class IV adenylate cyclase [Thermoanaerobaculia bacterium]
MSGKRDSIESELKFLVQGFGSVRERLVELEAERASASALEDNWVLDQDGVLAGADCLLRVRQDRNGARVTFKGPPSFQGHLKQREERECGIDDAEEMLALLERLGFTVVHRYQKHREEWHLGGVTIALDHTPIGDFVEFEGEGAEKLAQRCGLAPETAERRSYLRLYLDHLSDNPELPRDMLFEDGD